MAQVPGRCGDSPEKVLINYNRHFLQVIPDLEDGEFELPDELQTLAGFKKLWFERPKTYRGVPMGSTQLFPRPSVPSHGGNRAVEPQYWGMIVEQLSRRSIERHLSQPLKDTVVWFCIFAK